MVSEEPKTFFDYDEAKSDRTSGKRFRHDVAEGREVIWMSERDGWNHLYLIDGATGAVKNQITKGEWVVRAVEKVDEEARQIYFSANGMYAGKDPYCLHFYRIDFDGRPDAADGREPITRVTFSPTAPTTWTPIRASISTVSELHRTATGALVAEIEHGDITALVKAGWKPPEVFVAKGRDGRTDIWGVIFRPTGFDPARSTP